MGPEQFYSPESMPINNTVERPRLPRGMKIAAIILAGVLLLGGLIYLILSSQDQSTEHEEPAIEYAGNESRVAGIQFLLEYGLSFDQYTATFQKLTEAFDKIDPDAAYFDYVVDSLAFEAGSLPINQTMSDADRDAIVTQLANTGDRTATIFYDNEAESEELGAEAEEELLDVIVFKMTDEKETEYTVKLTPSPDLKSVTMEIFNASGEKLN